MRDDAGTVEELSKNKKKSISVKNAEKLVRELKYVECFAWTQKGLKNVFDGVILAALEPQNHQKTSFVWFSEEINGVSVVFFKRATMWVNVINNNYY